jgi:hypothetical protein
MITMFLGKLHASARERREHRPAHVGSCITLEGAYAYILVINMREIWNYKTSARETPVLKRVSL